jgi:molybdopterin-guanine dinucleotide biosynthesis protein MobB
MGRRKEEVRFRNRALWAYAWNALGPVVGEPVLLQGADRAPPGLEPSPDRRRGEGPLGGIETLLERARDGGRPGVVLCAVDLPRVPASLVVDLVRRWRESPDPGNQAVVAWDGERVQPLLGVYGAGLLTSLTTWLDGGGSRAVHLWLDALGDRVERVRPADGAGAVGHGEPLLNLNRPEDLQDAARLPLPAPPIISVVGWKDSGKTSAATALVRSLAQRGWRVMALKHGHGFRLDREGTDSARLREGGAERVVLAGPDGFGVLGGWGPGRVEEAGGRSGGEGDATELAARHLAEADVVVAEGWKTAPLPAIEVLGPRAGDEPPLWTADRADRDRFLARVAPEGVVPGGSVEDEPPALDRDAPDLGERLASLVEARVIPGWRR